jgi:hypothetical protein
MDAELARDLAHAVQPARLGVDRQDPSRFTRRATPNMGRMAQSGSQLDLHEVTANRG